MLTNVLSYRLPTRSLTLTRPLTRPLTRLLSTPTTPPPIWTTPLVRSTFLNYFTSKHNHTFYPSSPCVPVNDPTLMFANAGMNQYKSIFLGQTPPGSPLAALTRATNSQKCIRAGGKHNDLEEVGVDTYHHTFFEMLGTWSFDDYFKKETIGMAWDLLTNVYGVEGDRLYATYFEGDEKLGVPMDVEARDFWLEFLPEERVIASNAGDNFWEMGETGPCGPCSELHYDRIGGRNAADLVNMDDPDVIEIWNLVFIQYNKDEKGMLRALPAKHIDTGMGLERLVSVLQDERSNYDTDAFMPLFDELQTLSGAAAYRGRTGAADVDLVDTGYRAIADHVRALCFAIADGAVPSNEGRGYVLRRILRRGVRYGRQVLGAEEGFFTKLVPVVVKSMGEAYPELVEKEGEIVRLLEEEEKAFSVMMERGIKFFNNLKIEMGGKGETVVNGKNAFFLYDSMGFPVDLTMQMATESGLSVDVSGFEAAMEEQREMGRRDRKMKRGGGGEVLELIAGQTSWLKDNGIEVTDDGGKYGRGSDGGARVVAIFDGEVDGGEGGDASREGFRESADEGQYVGLILDRTTFYAEGGGQESDEGVIEVGGGTFAVKDCQVFGGYVMHVGTLNSGIKVGDEAVTVVDEERRIDLASHHTMTHVLNYALRKVLEGDVDQRGSLVASDKLRFDFTAKKALTVDQVREVGRICKEQISEERVVYDEVVRLGDAQMVSGIRAVFGETYPDPVRVVSVGQPVSDLTQLDAGLASIEFCGGTHLGNLKSAEDFVITEETAVAKGVRRIVAVTRGGARKCRENERRVGALLEKVEATLIGENAVSLRKELDASFMCSAAKSEMRGRLEAVQKKIVEGRKAEAGKRLNGVLGEVTEAVVGKDVVCIKFVGIEAKGSQKIAEIVRKVNPACSFFGIIESEDEEGKVACFASVPDGRAVAANKWVNEVLGRFGGMGGGKEGFAQGQARGCKSEEVIKVALEVGSGNRIS